MTSTQTTTITVPFFVTTNIDNKVLRVVDGEGVIYERSMDSAEAKNVCDAIVAFRNSCKGGS